MDTNTSTQAKDDDELSLYANFYDSAQLLLSEKRTALSVLRTGASIFVLPLSVLSLLIATSKFYEADKIWHLMVPVLILCACLILLSLFLVIRSIKHIRRYERQIRVLKNQHPLHADLID